MLLFHILRVYGHLLWGNSLLTSAWCRLLRVLPPGCPFAGMHLATNVLVLLPEELPPHALQNTVRNVVAVVRKKPRALHWQVDVARVIPKGTFDLRAASIKCHFQLHVAMPVHLSV